MWVNPLHLTIAALTLLLYVTVAAPTHQTLEDGTVLISNSEHGMTKRSVFLRGWSGCDEPQKNEIINSWKMMLEMANKIKDKIDFEEVVARDFFGDPEANRFQDSIRLLIQHVTTWTFGSVFAWHLEMGCDDRDRRITIREHGGDESFGCPRGTAKEDYYKCNSRCWQPRTYADGSVYSWSYRAVAYAQQGPGGQEPIAYMNWCPKWFTLPKCVDAYNKNSRSKLHDKWDLNYYVCKESTMMHELMHVDAHATDATHNKIEHVMDRRIKIYDSDYNKDKVVQAYGALYTKVLANWGKLLGGLFVATNADNLAFYFLAKWIQETGGYYPHLPRTNDRPVESPGLTDPNSAGELPPDVGPPNRDPQEVERVPAAIDTPDRWDPIIIANGKVATGDINDLVSALGLGHDTAAVGSTYVFADPNLDCFDLAAAAEDSTPGCYTRDNDKNAAIELDASIGFPPQVPPKPTPTPELKFSLNIILEQTDWMHGQVLRREMKWLFYPTVFGTASQCSDHPEPAAVATNVPNTVRGVENGYMTRGCPVLYNEDLNKTPAGCSGPNYINDIPFPGGTYNFRIDGEDCQYLNNGQGNAGAVWCGDKYKSGCKAHDDKDKANLDGVKTCDNLSRPNNGDPMTPGKQVSHRAVVACEW